MGFAEIQFAESVFLSLLRTLASAAPNPFPTFDFLPKDQLIRSLTFGSMPEFGPPQGLTRAPGTLVVSLPVTINHVSIDELEAKPNDAGTNVSATMWADISMADETLSVEIVRVDVGKKHHTLPTPVSLMSQEIEVPLEDLTIHKAALLRDTDTKLVVVRLAMSAGSVSSLLTTPVIDHTDKQQWAIFVDQNVLTTKTRNQFNATLTEQLTPKDAPMPFPDGIVLEDAVKVVWDLMPNGTWGMTITVGLLAIDACPTVIGDDVNMSVEMIMSLEFTPDLPDKQLDLKMHVTHDVSDWDSFKCGFQNILGGWVLSISVPLLASIRGVAEAIAPWSIFAAVWVLVIAFPLVIDDMTGDTVGDQDLKDKDFKKLDKPQGDDDATYTGKLDLPVFPGGSLQNAFVDVFGLTVRGGGLLPAVGQHRMTITPSVVSGSWDDRYSCSSFSWELGDYLCTPVAVTDTVSVLNTRPTVTLFDTTEARPKKKWKVELNHMATEVTVVAKGTPEVGTDGKLWVHSSAGLASVPIAKVAKRREPPTGPEMVSMNLGCRQTGNPWKPGGFDLRWLVDPPPFEAVVDILRQWVLQAPDLAGNSTIDVTTVGQGAMQRFQLKGGGTRNTISLTTPSTQTLHVTIGGSATVNVVVSQRLLVAFAATDLDAPVVSLSRTPSGGIAARTEKSVSVLAVDGTTLQRRSTGGVEAPALDKRRLAGLAEPAPPPLAGRTTAAITERPSVTTQVRTLALEGERVIVASGSRILMARPWGARRNIIF